MQGNDTIEGIRDSLHEALTSSLNFAVKEDYERRYPFYRVAEWGSRTDELISVLENAMPKPPAMKVV